MAYGMSNYRRLQLIMTQLERDRSSWDAHWRELGEFIKPRVPRFFNTERNQGSKKNQKIINSAATMAARTLRSGMMAGNTSPARPWRKLGAADPEIEKYGPVKRWLWDVTEKLRVLDHRSNFYNAAPQVYEHLGIFGTAAMGVFEDEEDTMRCMVYPIGSYSLSTNERGIVDTFARRWRMTVRQVVERFVYGGNPRAEPDWTVASTTVKNLWDRAMYETDFEVNHVVHPNADHDPMALGAKWKLYASCYFESACSEETFLRESGFDEFPVLCPRWDANEDDVYGSSPGMEALGDIKALQTLERRKAQATEKMVNPPMTAPSALRNQKMSTIPGDVTFVDVREGQQGFRPAHEVRFSVKEQLDDIREHQQRISRAFYEDLFLMLTLSDRREITAREVAERHEEKLLMLGPTLERMNDEFLDPYTDREFAIAVRAGMIPPPPPELEQQPIKVEYISVMAQAQKLAGVSTTERFVSFATNIAAQVGDPSVLDKVNFDAIIEETADQMAMSPYAVRSDDEVQAIRKQRQDQQMAMQNAQRIDQLSKAARNLSTTDMSQPSALRNIADAASRGDLAGVGNQ